LTQAAICAWNPVDEEWQQRFRGWVSAYSYGFDPSQRVNRLQVELIDIFEMLAAIEMLPDGTFGDTPPASASGQVYFDEATHAGARITQALGNALIDPAFYVVFEMNVSLIGWPYSPAESPMTVIQEAADAEFPAANIYTDRFGRLVAHGRLAKFDPEGTIAAGGPIPNDVWDWHHWHAGDGAAAAAAPGTVTQLRGFGFERGLATIRNSALATPMGILDDDAAGQVVTDPTSIGVYGIRSWSAQNLLTLAGLLDSSSALEETHKHSEYVIANYANPTNRPGPVMFRSFDPAHPGAQINWQLLTRVDISDQIDITVGSPGGGGFTDEQCFVEGIRESCQPLNPDYDDHTVELDLSPRALFTDNPYPTP
jgi:hypothetical protein